MSTDLEQHVIRVREMAYRFPGPESPTLRVPAFDVIRGEHTAVIGPSGCGKTTLLRLIVGSLIPTAGSVQTLGIEPLSQSARRRGETRLHSIGMVFQDFALLDYITALDNIVLTARLGRSGLSAARERAHRLAERTGIRHTLGRSPRRLSQGERQRVAICRALVTEPELIVCDEPTGNLDPTRSREVMDLVLREAASIGATVLVVTHDRTVLDRFDRVVDLSDVASMEGRPL